MESRKQYANVHRQHNKVLHFLSNNTIQLMETEALNNGIQSLITGSISHYIRPHDFLVGALLDVQHHLHANQPHMTLSRMDYAFYYNEVKFRTFRQRNTLFLVLDVPVMTNNLKFRFQIYDLIKMPLQTPNREDYYSMLATDIKTIGFSPDADHLIQMTGHRGLPDGDVWFVSDTSLTFVDRNRPTCTRALIGGNLSELKATCRYTIYKYPYPRLVTRLYGNTFLLTKISQLHMNCPKSDDTSNEISTVDLTKVQTIYTFDSHVILFMQMK